MRFNQYQKEHQELSLYIQELIGNDDIEGEVVEIASQDSGTYRNMKTAAHSHYLLWVEVLSEAYQMILDKISNPNALKE